MSEYNALRLVAYSSGTTPVDEAGLDSAEGVRFATLYPGGLYGDLSFYLPWPVTVPWPVKHHYRLCAYNGLELVWEGEVTGIDYVIDQARQGLTVTCMGYWSSLLMARNWRKPWADTRLEEQAWRYITTAPGAEKCTLDRNNRLRFTPKAVAWASTEAAGVLYTAPTGETVKRVTANYNLQEGAQNWQIEIAQGASVRWSTSTTGTGSVDHTFVTPSQSVTLVFRANANQTPASDGTIYGEFTSVVVYTETGSITLTEIAKDIRARITDLSAYEGLILSDTLDLIPFVSEGETLADCLTRAASYGDIAYNSWAVGVRGSNAGTDDKPVLFAEPYPSLAAYDYLLSMDGATAQGTTWQQGISEVRNWIAVQYRDDAGHDVWVTPDDDANLKDTTSITAYGQREEWLSLDTTSTTTAKNYARRFLAARKDPQWMTGSGIPVQGYILGAGGEPIPTSQIRAGMRVRVQNFLSDLNVSGLTFLITATEYDDSTETCTISIGRPDTLAVWLARQDAQIGV